MRPRSQPRDGRGGDGLSRRRFVALALAAAGAVAAGAAGAQSLNDRRAAGAVGEAFDGYARVRQAGGGTAAFVGQVNAKRRAIYETRARQQSTTADQVGRVYARQIMAKAPPGTWFLTESGKWVRK